MRKLRDLLSKLSIWLKIAAVGVGLLLVTIYAKIRSARREGEIIGRAASNIEKVREAEARGDVETVRRELLK